MLSLSPSRTPRFYWDNNNLILFVLDEVFLSIRLFYIRNPYLVCALHISCHYHYPFTFIQHLSCQELGFAEKRLLKVDLCHIVLYWPLYRFYKCFPILFSYNPVMLCSLFLLEVLSLSSSGGIRQRNADYAIMYFKALHYTLFIYPCFFQIFIAYHFLL